MSDDDFDQPKGKKAAPKRVAKKDMYQALVVIIDCGSHMKKADVGGASSFECTKEAVDWILTRKIFTQSKDKVNIVLLGAEQTQNDLNAEHIAVKDELLAYVGFDHLRFLQEEVQMTRNEASVVDGLQVAVEFLKSQTVGDMAVDTRQILLITNDEASLGDEKQLKHLESDITNMNGNLIVMGLDASSSTKPSTRLQKTVENVDGTSISFSDASKALHNLTQKKVAARAMKKNWEILPGVLLPLAFHMRSTPAKNPLKAVTVNSKGEEVKREQQYFVKGKTADDEFMDDDDEAGGKAVEKQDLVYGYLFGKSKVILTEDDVALYGSHNFNEGDKGGCLKLLQFTKKSNVPPSFFLGTNSYSVVPAYDKKTAERDGELMKLTLALVESMLEQDTVAICRYAYHASAHLQLMALIPRKDEESGQLYMTAIRLPFMDDWRPFSLPDVSLRGPPPSAEKLNAIDELIDAMDLSKTDNTYEDVLNPFFQRQCAVMKAKALKQMGVGSEVNMEPSVFLKRSLQPDPRLVEAQEFKKLASTLPEIFNLEEIIRIKRSRKDIIAQNKDFLKGFDEEEEEEDEEETVKAEFEPIAMPDPEGPHKKFWDKVRKALESGGNAINSWTNHVASEMTLFDEGSLAAVEKFKILRTEMLAKERVADFNQWMMSLHGNDEYSDFFQFMDSRNEPSLITKSESADSWYTEVESEMFWSGMLEDEKKK